MVLLFVRKVKSNNVMKQSVYMLKYIKTIDTFCFSANLAGICQ